MAWPQIKKPFYYLHCILKCVLIIDYTVTSMVNKPLANSSEATDVAAFDLSSSVENDTDDQNCGVRLPRVKSKT